MEIKVSGRFRIYTNITLPVFLYVLRARLASSQPLVPVLHQQPPDDVPGHLVQVLRPLHPSSQDLLVDTEWIVIKERRVSGQHLVYEDPQRPPVHRLVVPLGLDDLRCEILRGPTQCPGAVCYLIRSDGLVIVIVIRYWVQGTGCKVQVIRYNYKVQGVGIVCIGFK